MTTRRQLEALIVALVSRPGIEAEAATYARDARVYHEWEALSEAPLDEAAFADDLPGRAGLIMGVSVGI